MDMIWRAAIAGVGFIVFVPMLVAWPMHYANGTPYLRTWATGSMVFGVSLVVVGGGLVALNWVIG